MEAITVLFFKRDTHTLKLVLNVRVPNNTGILKVNHLFLIYTIKEGVWIYG